MTDLAVPARPVDVHALPVMLTAPRLPGFHRHWSTLAESADKEGWPAASFLAALAELEIAERETRRIRRHLLESRLPGGKTLATFDCAAIPRVPRARVEALAAGDWIETGANLIVIGSEEDQAAVRGTDAPRRRDGRRCDKNHHRQPRRQ